MGNYNPYRSDVKEHAAFERGFSAAAGEKSFPKSDDPEEAHAYDLGWKTAEWEKARMRKAISKYGLPVKIEILADDIDADLINAATTLQTDMNRYIMEILKKDIKADIIAVLNQDRGKISLDDLITLLEHRELWPDGFVWNYRKPEGDVYTLVTKTLGLDTYSTPFGRVSHLAEIVDIPEHVAFMIFHTAYEGLALWPDDIKPEHVVSFLKRYKHGRIE